MLHVSISKNGLKIMITTDVTWNISKNGLKKMTMTDVTCKDICKSFVQSSVIILERIL